MSSCPELYFCLLEMLVLNCKQEVVALSRCPRCGSYNVKKISSWSMFLTLLASGGCLVWLATRFPPLWVLAGIVLLFSFFVLIGKSSLRCLDCKHAWVAKKGVEKQVRQENKEKEKKEKR
jgi:hypothetical protein